MKTMTNDPNAMLNAQCRVLKQLGHWLLVIGLLLWRGTTPAMAQDDGPKPPEITTYALTLKPVGPPAPSFRYELVPSARELLPDAQKMRELAFLLTLRCRLHAADGKIDLALRDVETGFVLARHAAQGPTLIHFLIGTAISSMFITELQQVMQTPGCPNLYWS